MSFGSWERVWCYYRNVVHAVYREARHIGGPGDYEAKCQVADRYLPAAQKCRKNRLTLKSSVPFRKVTGSKTDDVIGCYETLTGLNPEELVEIFRLPKWTPKYDGEKWAKITEVLLGLKQAIDDGELEAAVQICEKVRELRHNSGPLVPTSQEWKENRWVREKWPVLCEH